MSKKVLTLAELAQITGAAFSGDPLHEVTGVQPLEGASNQDVSFLSNMRYREAMLQSKAGVVCVDPTTPLTEGKNFLISDNPSRTFQMIVEIFFDPMAQKSGFEGIHPTAVIHPSAQIDKTVSIGPYVVIDKDTTIGPGTQLMAFVSIGPGVAVGKDCLFYPHSVVRELCVVGDRVILQPGAVIGSCGFGYTTDKQGNHQKLEQVGNVVLEDDVEVGAHTAIDRARFKETRISKGTKIDNLVQIGHNAQIGPHNLIVSQTGLSGSCRTGSHVIFGGQAGVIGHVEIASGSMIATRGGVSKSLTKPGKYAGGPVVPLSDFNRREVQLRNIGEYVKRIEALEKKLEDLSQAKLENSI